MKNFTKSLMLVAATATAFSAGAQAKWTVNHASKDFFRSERSGPVVADFNNDDLVDLLIVGEMHGDDQMHWWDANDKKIYHSSDGAPTGVTNTPHQR